MDEGQILKQAISATNREIFDSALDREPSIIDESGDKSLEEIGQGLEGQIEDGDEDDNEVEVEVEEAEPAKDGKIDAKPEPKVELEQPKPDGRVPPGRLREQTDRTRAAETEREALKAQLETERQNSRAAIEALNAKVEGVLAALQRQQPVPPKADLPKAPEVPDLFEDPKAFADFITNGFKTELQQRDKQIQEMRVENSLQVAHARHGDVFMQAFEAAKKLDPRNPDESEIRHRIYVSPNPGEALVQWHKRNEVLREVGNDPAKYRETVAAQTREALMKDPEFRRQLIEELRSDAELGDNGSPRTITKLPGSLNRLPGGNRRGSDGESSDNSNAAIFGSVFNSN